MRENFDKSFTLTVMQFEGGARFTNDPDDPGGATKYGISKKANPDLDIVHLTEQQAKDVYLQRYWLPSGCDEMPYPWDVIMFDAAVNMGVSKAIKIKSLSSSPAGFHMGRIFFYTELVNNKPNMAKYFRGWVNRVVRLWTETK